MSYLGVTLVSRVARQLADISLESEAGAYIGAEDELIERLGVSRPTLRQAAKIAENERMISVRRGVRGGFYAARPDVTDAMRTLNRFLRLQGAGVKHLGVLRSIHVEAAGLASACDDPDLRARLGELVAEADRCDDARAMMALDTRFAAHLAVMSGNPVAELIVGLSYTFGRDEQGVFLYAEPAQRAAMRPSYKAIAAAVLAGDAALARFESERRIALLHRWIDEADVADLRPITDLKLAPD